MGRIELGKKLSRPGTKRYLIKYGIRGMYWASWGEPSPYGMRGSGRDQIKVKARMQRDSAKSYPESPYWPHDSPDRAREPINPPSFTNGPEETCPTRKIFTFCCSWKRNCLGTGESWRLFGQHLKLLLNIFLTIIRVFRTKFIKFRMWRESKICFVVSHLNYSLCPKIFV